MMNLNKYYREAFVRAVMDDVPRIDYDEQAKALVIPVLEARLPKEMRHLQHLDGIRGLMQQLLLQNLRCMRLSLR